MTEAELIEAIQSALTARADDDPSVFTATDVVGKLGWSRPRVLRSIRSLIEAGKASSTKSWRPDIAGRLQPVPAYRLHV
jgi:hypothetical protein